MKKLICIFIATLLYSQNLSHISTKRLAGQMIIMGFNGKNVKDYSVRKLGQEASLGKLGGVVFRANNFEELEQAKKLVTRFKNIAIVNPLFLAIDYMDLDNNTDFNFCKEVDFVASNKNLNDAKLDYLKTALNLKDLGINLDLSLKINTKIYDDNINKLSLYAREYADSFKQSNILVAIKNFPGDLNEKGRVINDYRLIFLKPFYDFINTNRVDIIIISNKIYPALDTKPASMSSKIISILKNDLNYQGLIMSDDILGGDLDEIEFKKRIIDSINAGVDILYFSMSKIKYGDTASFVVDVINDAVKDGLITRKRLEESYIKITKLKEQL